MKIEVLKISDLKPYENNPRNNLDAVEAVANSLRRFGWQQPIVIDKDNVIVAGHTRYEAAKRLAMDKVPCKRAEDLTEEQIKAYRLADNKTSELAGWNFEKLEQELEELADFGMEDFGFDFSEAEKELDEVPDLGESGFTYSEQYGVIVICQDEAEQEKVYTKLNDMGYECRVVAT